MERDPSLDTLWFLDGTVYVLDPAGAYWAKIIVKSVPVTAEKPHGLDYSLTLHGPDSGNPNDSRLVGFDNAHRIRPQAGPAGGRRKAGDHKHRFRTVQPYDYEDAASLLEDFWRAVDDVLSERGI